MTNKFFLTALVIVGFGVAAQATPITFNFFENGLGTLGTSSTFTESGVSVTAYGFTSGGVATALYAKNGGVGEMGLGIASDSDHEINSSTFVQLNLTTLSGSSLSSLFFGSVQSGETALIYFSNTLGLLGAPIGSVTSDSTFDVTSYLNGYVGVTTSGVQGYVDPNVLITTLTANTTNRVPDGGTTLALLGGALTALALIRRKLVA